MTAVMHLSIEWCTPLPLDMVSHCPQQCWTKLVQWRTPRSLLWLTTNVKWLTPQSQNCCTICNFDWHVGHHLLTEKLRIAIGIPAQSVNWLTMTHPLVTMTAIEVMWLTPQSCWWLTIVVQWRTCGSHCHSSMTHIWLTMPGVSEVRHSMDKCTIHPFIQLFF